MPGDLKSLDFGHVGSIPAARTTARSAGEGATGRLSGGVCAVSATVRTGGSSRSVPAPPVSR